MNHPGKPFGPAHDRVGLTADERATLASFERSLGDDLASGGPGGRAHARLADRLRILGRAVPRFIRLSPWLALLGILALPVAIAASDVAGLTCALFITVALTTWLVTARGRWARWLARQIAPAQQAERGRAQDDRRRWGDDPWRWYG
jgi:hypothetical protein